MAVTAMLCMFISAFYAELPMLARASALLAGHVPLPEVELVNEQRLRAVLSPDFDKGSGRHAEVETALYPLFAALPKDADGGLGHNTVRYALNRYFAQSVKGLVVGGVQVDSATMSKIPKDMVASYVQDLVAQKLGGRSSGLQDLSSLAVALERIQDMEINDRFEAALELHSLRNASVLTDADAETVLVTYMMTFILGRNPGSMGLAEVELQRHSINEAFPPWSQALEISIGALGDVLAGRQSLRRAEVARVAAEADKRVASAFQDVGCKGLKNSLLKFEDGGSGRVALENFYKVVFADKWSWHLQENRDYLRALAALDETDKRTARVIVANYMTAEPNCIGSTGFGALCCVSECDALFASLEKEIAAPDGEPTRIIGLVEALSSSTVPAPRELSTQLKQRLHQVATRHGGAVPLHGRLFAQWMHHAFPRECPFPRAPGSSTSAERARSDASAMAHRASAMGTEHPSSPLDVLRDELQAGRLSATDDKKPTSLRREACRTVFLVAALAATLLGLWRMAKTVLQNAGFMDQEKAD